MTPHSLAAKYLLRGMLISASITLTFLLIALYKGEREHMQDIGLMGLIVCTIHLFRYLFFVEPALEQEQKDE
jgi:hypothetical protein